MAQEVVDSVARSPERTGMRKLLGRYVGMSARAATVVTLAALVIFAVFGSFHWRLWWVVPPVWLGLFVISLVLAPVMGIQPGRRRTGRLPWLALVTVSLAVLTAAILGVEAAWTRLSLALLGSTGLGAGVYGVRTVIGKTSYRGRERRRNVALRARTDELLEAIRRMHRVATEMDEGTLPEEEGQRSLNDIEGRLRDLLGHIRRSAVEKPKPETD